jgi:hypothetical protein
MRTSQKTLEAIATIGVDLGKNTFRLVGLDKRGAIVLQQKVSHVADAPRQTGPSKPSSQGTSARAVKPGTKGGHKAHH